MQDRLGHFMVLAAEKVGNASPYGKLGGVAARVKLETQISKKKEIWESTIAELKNDFRTYIALEEEILKMGQNYIQRYQKTTNQEKIDGADESAAMFRKYHEEILPLKRKLLKNIKLL